MGKRLNLAQKAQNARQRKERRARIKQKMQQREFTLRNVLIGAGGARGASDGGNGASDGDNGGVPLRVLIIGDGDFSFSSSLVKGLQEAYRTNGGNLKGGQRRYARASTPASALPARVCVSRHVR